MEAMLTTVDRDTSIRCHGLKYSSSIRKQCSLECSHVFFKQRCNFRKSLRRNQPIKVTVLALLKFVLPASDKDAALEKIKSRTLYSDLLFEAIVKDAFGLGIDDKVFSIRKSKKGKSIGRHGLR